MTLWKFVSILCPLRRPFKISKSVQRDWYLTSCQQRSTVSWVGHASRLSRPHPRKVFRITLQSTGSHPLVRGETTGTHVAGMTSCVCFAIPNFREPRQMLSVGVNLSGWVATPKTRSNTSLPC
ncbi:unnamed protein product [Ectocarpus sp. 4 AP-2014]